MRYTIQEWLVILKHYKAIKKNWKYNLLFNTINSSDCCLRCWWKFSYFEEYFHSNGWYDFRLYTEDWKFVNIDHVIPKSKWWQDKVSNYQILCIWCNESKSTNVIDYRIKWLSDKEEKIARLKYF